MDNLTPIVVPGSIEGMFNRVQLRTMKLEFEKVDHITDEHWKRIRYLIKSCPDKAILHQLSAERIKFLSQIANYYLRTGVLRRP